MRVWVKARSKPAHFVCTTGRFCAHEGAEGVFLRLAAGLAGFALRSARDCVLPPRSANPCSRMEHSDCGAGINPSGDLRKLCNRRDGASGRAAARLSDPSPKKSMKSHPVGVLIFLIGLALGSSSPRAADQLEPLWAHGFATPPALGDKAVRQAMPSRKLRPNEDPDGQTDLRHVAGSTAADPRVDVRDGGNLIDRFPGDHRPMLNVIAHGPGQSRACVPGGWGAPRGTGQPARGGRKMLRSRGYLRPISSGKWDAFAAARVCRQPLESPTRRPWACWRRP